MNVFTVVKKLVNQPLDDRPITSIPSENTPSPSLPCTNSSLVLEKGKLKVTKDLSPEDVLHREEAYAAVLGDGPQQGQVSFQSII